MGHKEKLQGPDFVYAMCRRELLEHTGPSLETALAATALVAVVASAAVLHHHHELR